MPAQERDDRPAGEKRRPQRKRHGRDGQRAEGHPREAAGDQRRQQHEIGDAFGRLPEPVAREAVAPHGPADRDDEADRAERQEDGAHAGGSEAEVGGAGGRRVIVRGRKWVAALISGRAGGGKAANRRGAGLKRNGECRSEPT